MSIRDTVIWEDIKEIISDEKPRVHYKYRCEIEINDEVQEVEKLFQIDVTRQYNTKFSDEIVIKILLNEGYYTHHMVPNRDRLKVIIYKEPVKENGGDDNFDEDIEMKVYRGVLLENSNSKLEGKFREISSEEQSERTGYSDHYIQLYDLAAEKFRMKTTGGIYRGMRVDKFIQGMMTFLSANLKLDSTNEIEGVDVVKSDNEEERDHIVIPHGTRAVDIPNFVQKTCGVYYTEIGYYLQDNLWYVFPQYELGRFNKEPRNLTVLNLPARELPGIERTFFTDDERVVLIANGETQHLDTTESMMLNHGNGLRFVNADTIMDDFATGRGDDATISYEDNIVEFASEKRRTDLNMVPFSERRITSNIYHESSTIAPRLGSYIRVQWSYADPSLIYPGMPVKYVYLDDDDIDEIYGIVMGVDHMSAIKGQGVLASKYETTAIVTLFIQNERE